MSPVRFQSKSSPVAGLPDEQVRFLRDYLARLRASQRDDCYECYACVERVLAQLLDAATSPCMEA